MAEDFEKGLIGTLYYSDSADGCLEWLLPEAFLNPLNRTIFANIKKYYNDNGKKPEPLQVADMVKSEGFSDKDIIKYLSEAVRDYEIGFYALGTAETMMNRYFQRLLYKAITEPNGNDFSEKITEIQRIINSINVNSEMGEDGLEMAEKYAELYFCEKDVKSMKTGFYSIDEIAALEGGDIVVIGARPSVGKSAFSTQIAQNVALQGNKVLYFNLEMKVQQMYERIIANLGDINLTRLKNAVLFKGDDEKKYLSAIEQLKQIGKNLVIVSDRQNITSIRKVVKAQKPDLVIIDYLQLVKVTAVYKQRYVDVAELSHDLKGLALEMNIPIILLSQLNRLSGNGKEPSMSELRESGDIEQDASIVVLLWNEDENDYSKKGVKIEKNRQGSLGKFHFRFDGAKMRFSDEKDNFGFVEASGSDIPF